MPAHQESLARNSHYFHPTLGLYLLMALQPLEQEFMLVQQPMVEELGLFEALHLEQRPLVDLLSLASLY
jgi:hypothetical protein